MELISDKKRTIVSYQEFSCSKKKKLKSISCDNSGFTFIKGNNSTNVDTNHKKIMELNGFFHLLPDEILLKIFESLTIEELSILALVNTRIRNFVLQNFLISRSGFLALLKANQIYLPIYTPNQQSFVQKLFSSIGLLLKRCTMLFCTYERINILIHVLENSYGIPSWKNFNNSEFQNLKFITKCYAKIINRLINGWGDFECVFVFQSLKDVFEIDSHFKKFLNSSLGSRQKHELLIRHFFRMICSHHYESLDNFKEKLCWLAKTLNVFSPLEIAKLFIVIFGPMVFINNSFQSLPYIAWWDLTDSSFVEKGLEDLGLTFHFLFKHNNLIWSKDHIIKIFELTVNTPALWTHSNISTLLYYGGYELTLNFLHKKIKDGMIQDVAYYICYLNVITYKLSQDLSSILKLIDSLNEEDDQELIEEITQAFSDIIYQTRNTDLNDEDDIDPIESSEAIDSQLELMKLLMLKINFFKKFL